MGFDITSGIFSRNNNHFNIFTKVRSNYSGFTVYGKSKNFKRTMGKLLHVRLINCLESISDPKTNNNSFLL